MRKQFPYIRGYPLIPVVLAGPKEEIRILAFLDSGADYCLFSLEVAEKLGIKKGKGERICLQGVTGEQFIGYSHKVPVRIDGITFKCKIVFSQVRTALLGRNNFFLPFLVTFNEKHQKVSLKKYK